LLSLLTAYLFCLVIEQPAIRWSRRISSQPITFQAVTDLESLDPLNSPS
jgi:hypothetical protein